MSNYIQELPTITKKISNNVADVIFKALKQANPSADINWDDFWVSIKPGIKKDYTDYYTRAEIEGGGTNDAKANILLYPRQWERDGKNNPSKRYKNETIVFTYSPIWDYNVLEELGFDLTNYYAYELVDQVTQHLITGLGIELGSDDNASNLFDRWEPEEGVIHLKLKPTIMALNDPELLDEGHFTYNNKGQTKAYVDSVNADYDPDNTNKTCLQLISVSKDCVLKFKKDMEPLPPEEELGVVGSDLNLTQGDIYRA